MKKSYLIPLFALSLAALPLAGCDEKSEQATPSPEATSVAPAETAAPAEVKSDAIVVSDVYTYATIPSAQTGAIFATLTNTTGKADLLQSVKTDIAETIEIHQTYEDPQTGASLMRKTSGVDVPANGAAKLEPNGFHIMLIGLKQPLTPGTTFDATLTFRDAGDIVVSVEAVPAGQAGVGTPDASAHQHGTDEHEAHGGVAAPDAPANDEPGTYTPKKSGHQQPSETITPAQATPSDAPLEKAPTDDAAPAQQ